jgi:hypothetical protein
MACLSRYNMTGGGIGTGEPVAIIVAGTSAGPMRALAPEPTTWRMEASRAQTY